MEEWLPIEGYEGLYEVSNLGFIRSLGNGKSNNSKCRLLKPRKDTKNYKVVVLSKEGKRKPYYIHRLVAQAFIPNPNNYPIVNHKDENPSNNVVENLEWCTYSYNLYYGMAIEKRRQKMCGEKHPMYGKFGKEHKRSKPINQYTKDGKFIKKWDCGTDIKRELCFDNSHISKCALGKCKSAYGYVWKYAS